MNIKLRLFAWFGVFAIATASILSSNVRAQTFPEKAVRIVVPYTVGGGTDTVARKVAEELRSRLGQTVIVENRPGANGVIGTNAVARSAPDGHTYALVVTTHLLNPLLVKDLPYDTFKDLMGVTMVATSPMVLVAKADFPANDPREMGEVMRREKGQYSYGSSENMTRLVAAFYAKLQGVDMVHVPYKGGAPMLTDIAAGVTTIGMASMLAAKPLVEADRIKPLGVTGGQRSAILPDVPTMLESGMEEFEVYTTYSLYAPAGTPRAILDKMQQEVHAAVHTPEMVDFFAKLAATPVANTVDDFQAQIERDYEFWSRLVKDVGLQPE